jgi:hypothetical protein
MMMYDSCAGIHQAFQFLICVIQVAISRLLCIREGRMRSTYFVEPSMMNISTALRAEFHTPPIEIVSTKGLPLPLRRQEVHLLARRLMIWEI